MRKLTLRWFFWTCALAPVACGGNTVGGTEYGADADSTGPRANHAGEASTDEEHGLAVCPDAVLPAPPSEADENWNRALASGEASLAGLPAESCGSTPGDVGSAAAPERLTFEFLETEGYQSSVGTGASCYRIDGVLDGYQFFVEAGADDVDLYVYSNDGFASEPICLNQDGAKLSVHCTTYRPSGPAIESAVRYIVIDGSKTMSGASLTLSSSG